MDRDDLFQEIVIQIWNSIPSFRQESAVTTWIYRISLNTAVKWSKKERKYSRSEELNTVENILEENKVIFDDRLIWLYEEIHKLDEIDRSIALLMLDGFSYKDMASIMGITESHIGVKINRIKNQLILKSIKM